MRSIAESRTMPGTKKAQIQHSWYMQKNKPFTHINSLNFLYPSMRIHYYMGSFETSNKYIKDGLFSKTNKCPTDSKQIE